MRWIAVAAVTLTACASMLTPANLAGARREMTAPVIGCPVSDTVVEQQTTPQDVWRARCLDRDRLYDCKKYGRATSSNPGDGIYGIACDPVATKK